MHKKFAALIFAIITFFVGKVWAGGDPLDQTLPQETPTASTTETTKTPIAETSPPTIYVSTVQPVVHVPVQTDNSKPLPANTKPRPRYGVASIACGVPSGCVGEMGFRPWYWLNMQVGAGYNGMSPGVIGSLVLDPIPWGVGISLSADVGHYWSGPVPFASNPPTVEYSFADFLGGLEFGNWKAWRIFFRGGLAYINATASNFNTPGSGGGNVVVGSPQLTAWAAPAFKMGVSFYF